MCFMKPMPGDLIKKSFQIPELLGGVFYSDEPEYFECVPDKLKKHQHYSLVYDRAAFKKFCLSNAISTPAFFYADSFDKISAWAIEKNKFPMVIKSVRNGMDGNGIYLLRAYRELPEFYEEIKLKYPEYPVLIEEFVTHRARIEVTCFNQKVHLATQTGLAKSMSVFHRWRAFPIALKKDIRENLCYIAGKFSSVLSLKNIPFRFTFAVANESLVLISLNCGLNRPEYYKSFSPFTSLESDLVPEISGCRKIQIYNSNLRADADDIKNVASEHVEQVLSDGQTTMIMLKGKDSKELVTVVGQIELLTDS